MIVDYQIKCSSLIVILWETLKHSKVLAVRLSTIVVVQLFGNPNCNLSVHVVLANKNIAGFMIQSVFAARKAGWILFYQMNGIIFHLCLLTMKVKLSCKTRVFVPKSPNISCWDFMKYVISLAIFSGWIVRGISKTH